MEIVNLEKYLPRSYPAICRIKNKNATDWQAEALHNRPQRKFIPTYWHGKTDLLQSESEKIQKTDVSLLLVAQRNDLQFW